MRRRRMRSRCPFDASNIAIKAWQGRRIGPLVIQIDSIVARPRCSNFTLKCNHQQQQEEQGKKVELGKKEEQEEQLKEDCPSCHPD